jgi:hypothetical protein
MKTKFAPLFPLIIVLSPFLLACGNEQQCPEDCATESVSQAVCRYDDCTPDEEPPPPDPAPTTPLTIGFNNTTTQTITVNVRLVERDTTGTILRDSTILPAIVVPGKSFPVWQNVTAITKGHQATAYAYTAEQVVSPSFSDTPGTAEHNCLFVLGVAGDLSGSCT